MRPIDAEPVIKMLKRLRRMADSHRRDLDLLNLQQLLEAAPVLDSVGDSSGATMKWVSVKDRLPELDEQCLCCYRFRNEGMRFIGVLTYFAADNEPHWQHEKGVSGLKVTHWMPLPELPKEESE